MQTEFVSAERIAGSKGLAAFGYELFSLHSDGFRKLTGPGVYMAVNGSGETFQIFYIGSAKNILA